jgi:hypothetical protein
MWVCIVSNGSMPFASLVFTSRCYARESFIIVVTRMDFGESITAA